MHNFKHLTIGLIITLILVHLLSTNRLLRLRIDDLEHDVGKLTWEIEEAVREIGFLQLEILKQ